MTFFPDVFSSNALSTRLLPSPGGTSIPFSIMLLQGSSLLNVIGMRLIYVQGTKGKQIVEIRRSQTWRQLQNLGRSVFSVCRISITNFLIPAIFLLLRWWNREHPHLPPPTTAPDPPSSAHTCTHTKCRAIDSSGAVVEQPWLAFAPGGETHNRQRMCRS